jgi:hypothetical protein
MTGRATPFPFFPSKPQTGFKRESNRIQTAQCFMFSITKPQNRENGPKYLGICNLGRWTVRQVLGKGAFCGFSGLVVDMIVVSAV